MGGACRILGNRLTHLPQAQPYLELPAGAFWGHCFLILVVFYLFRNYDYDMIYLYRNCFFSGIHTYIIILHCLCPLTAYIIHV